ncbi:lactate utilization protein [Solidesulfovibrio sp.]|uniref:lactate utilization protein n=1 Tax=Solidesulfovibrio sp. TaxID=2910990 RepID=UPI00260BCD8D|nr:lactate utilization protein [Solidesulfovibrio sp.]
MTSPTDLYYAKRLEEAAEALRKNHFKAHVVPDAAAAKALFLDEILPASGAKTVSYGGSMTLAATGLPQALAGTPGVEVLDTLDRSITPEQAYERRRQALLVDLFVTGTNAVTEDGVLVNLDMIGNRACAIAFGPRQAVVLVGRNKLVSDLTSAISRIKEFAAPANAMRLSKKTPCVATSHCEDCGSPERICNVWTITEKSFPRGRITVILINQDLGL